MIDYVKTHTAIEKTVVEKVKAEKVKAEKATDKLKAEKIKATIAKTVVDEGLCVLCDIYNHIYGTQQISRSP